MLASDLGACEWFVWDLRRSNLIDRGQLDQIVGEFLGKNPGAEPPLLADYLVKQGILTDFQAERLLQGKTQGFVLGPFTLMDALGTGSMGTVYKAASKTDGSWYAVKVLPRRSMWNVRIARRKVRLFEQCQHPAVVPFVDVGTAGGMHYLAWPLVEGRTLDKIVEEHKRLPAEQAAGYLLQASEGLQVAHQVDLFHGLLKPSNLMIGPDGVVRILDFGIGCLLAETEGESLVDTMSTANSVNSGLDCASPESIMDPTNLSALGDQYSLGCVLYYCLTGQYPFPDGTAVEKMMAHQHKHPTPIHALQPDVPQEMVLLVERLMEKEPQNRFGNCGELLEALRPLAQPGGAAGPQRRPTMQMPRVRVQRPTADSAAPPPPPTVAPDLSKPAVRAAQPKPAQPLPARAPTAAQAAADAPAPVVTRLPRPSDFGRKPDPAPAPQPANAAEESEQPAGNRFGMLTVILIAAVAGAAAFFLSKLIPIG